MLQRSNVLRSCVAVACALMVLAPAAKGEPAMWAIKDDDSTIYLLGTIHLLRKDTVWRSDKIKKAVAESTELWLEVSGAEGGMESLLGKYGVDPRNSLSRRLSVEQKERLLQAAANYSFPTHLLETMKPWYAAMTLTMLPLFKAGYNPNAGVEAFLTVQANAEGDKIIGLETLEEQLRIMDELPEADQIAFLMETLGDIEAGLAELEQLTKAWSEGNLELLAVKYAEEMKQQAPSLYQKILVDRNIRWSEQIATLLERSGVQTIAVGAGHLVGPDSLQEQLLKRGIKSERH